MVVHTCSPALGGRERGSIMDSCPDFSMTCRFSERPCIKRIRRAGEMA